MRKIIPVVALGAAMTVAGTSAGWATLNKDITLSVDGQPTALTTTAGTVGELLRDEGITVTGRDIVAPDPSAKVTDGTRVAVQFARRVNFDVDGQQKAVWTTATSLDQALAALGVDTAGADLSTSRSASIGREGLAVAVDTLKTVTIEAAGKKRQVETTGDTVADALAAAKIKVDKDDKLSVDARDLLKSGAAITYTKVDVARETEQETVFFTTETQSSSALLRGTSQVETTGRPGSRTLTFEVVREDGKVVSRKKVSSKVTDPPRTRMVLVGTKAPVAPVAPKAPSSPAPSSPAPSSPAPSSPAPSSPAPSSPAPSSPAPSSPSSSSPSKSGDSASSRPSSDSSRSSDPNRSSESSSSPSSSSSTTQGSTRPSAPSVASGSVWDRLAQCESGGNWGINTGNGFYGGLQFTPSTWRGYGGTGMPHEASRAEQIAVAQRVQAGQGWGAWPACTAKLGIR